MGTRGRIRSIDVRGLPPRLGRLRPRIELAARAVLRAHSVASYALSITFVGDRRIATLNRRALGRSGATDVIAFDLSEPGLPSGVVGDIYISLDRARAASRDFQVTESEELIRLVVHGVLHVVGYRDAAVSSRRRMESAQERLVKRLVVVKRGAGGGRKRAPGPRGA